MHASRVHTQLGENIIQDDVEGDVEVAAATDSGVNLMQSRNPAQMLLGLLKKGDTMEGIGSNISHSAHQTYITFGEGVFSDNPKSANRFSLGDERDAGQGLCIVDQIGTVKMQIINDIIGQI